jgi:hypothetical protein
VLDMGVTTTIRLNEPRYDAVAFDSASRRTARSTTTSPSPTATPPPRAAVAAFLRTRRAGDPEGHAPVLLEKRETLRERGIEGVGIEGVEREDQEGGWQSCGHRWAM